ncbi:MAG: hypothetical protein H0X43_00165 [Nitrosospira sp.]|nr:hypothetical protein [Nitrosospira sp.]
MSIFAGAFALQPNRAIPATLIDELRAALSRHPGDVDVGSEFINDGIFIAKIDVGALCEPGEYSDDVVTAYVAGDPILQSGPGASPVSRADSLQVLAQDVAAGQDDALRSCRGTYCAVIYERSPRRLHLVTDKLGVRPLYMWILPDYIIFATALRILEAVTFSRKSINRQGVAEIACFGYPLADRTPYSNIFSLHAGEWVSSGNGNLLRRRYWRLDRAQPPAASGMAPPQRLYRLFVDSVKVRLRRQTTVAAFLSGGLDSRAIVSALKSAGADIFTANFAPPGSQDQVFGQLAADRLGTHHTYLQRSSLGEGDPYSKATVGLWLGSADYLACNPQRPRVVWSGDGGSAGLGHIYLNSDIVAAARRGDLWRAARKFLAYNHWGLQAKLLKPRIAAELTSMVDDGIRAELESIKPADPGRILYLFLMLNDQRRHMFNHFENLDLARIEFEMPFFDADFVTSIMQEPIDSFLRHNFYLEWLKCFPAGVLETPWQAYPNHIPCPLPQPEGLSYQWGDQYSANDVKSRRRIMIETARTLLREPHFSHEYLDYRRMRLSMLLMRWGKADRSYLMHVPTVLYRYWSRTATSVISS